jgi:hypothetical protein
MSVTTDILNGVAQLLNDAAVGVFDANRVWTLTDTQTAITFKDVPAVPDRVLALSPFGANSDNPLTTYGRQQLQLRARGTTDPRDVDQILDSAFTVLHGATNLTFGSVHVVQILRVSTIPLGMDQQDRRWQRSDNYQLDVDLPTSPLRPI